MNLVSLLNGRKNLMQLGHETGLRVLYHIVSERDDDDKPVLFTLGRKVFRLKSMFRIDRSEYVD